MRQFEDFSVRVKTFGETLSAESGESLSEKIGGCIAELKRIVLGNSGDNKLQVVRSWFCLDFVKEERPSKLYSLSTIKCRIDLPWSESSLVRLYITIVMTLKRPQSFDALSLGRHNYRIWLLREFSKQLRNFWDPQSGHGIERLADDAKFWIAGDVARIYHCDKQGIPQLSKNVLGEPEDAFTDTLFVVGGQTLKEWKRD